MTLNDVISQTLSQHNVIIHQQLSYLANVSVGESRGALEQYYETAKAQNLHPVFIVSGSRFVHGQLSYVYLITRPSKLTSTKAKFQTVVAVQYYGLIAANEEPNSAQLQDFLNYAQQLLQQTELVMLTQQPLLEANPLRTNAYSAIRNDNVVRKENAYSKTIKTFAPTKSTPSPFDDDGPSPSTTNNNSSAPKAAAKPNTIQQKQQVTLLNFNSTSKNTKPSTSAFDDFDDIVETRSAVAVKKTLSKTVTNNTPTTSTTTTTASKRPSSFTTSKLFEEIDHDEKKVKERGILGTAMKDGGNGAAVVNVQPTHNLFDEFDDDSSFVSNTKSKSTHTKPSNTKSSGTGSNKSKGKKAQIVFDSEEESGADMDPFDMTYTGPQQSNSLMGDNSDNDSDDDMVKMAKGKAVQGKKGGRLVIEDDDDGKKSDGTKPKKTIIDDDDSDDDYAKSVMRTNAEENVDRRESTWKKISKEEYTAMQREEEDRQREAEKEKRDKIQAANQKALSGGPNPDPQQPQTRINSETGKTQQLVKVAKMITRVDEEGFDVKEEVYIEEWHDVAPKPITKATTAPKAPAPSPAPPKLTVKKAEPPKNGGIMSFFQKK